MKTVRKILIVIAFILLFLQLAAYLGNTDQDAIEVTGINAIYYYAGFNFPNWRKCSAAGRPLVPNNSRGLRPQYGVTINNTPPLFMKPETIWFD